MVLIMSYGVSITDACIGWEETTSLLLDLSQQLAGKEKTEKITT